MQSGDQMCSYTSSEGFVLALRRLRFKTSGYQETEVPEGTECQPLQGFTGSI
jgi:hypothetical protein